MNANIKSLSLIGTVWFSVSQSLAIRWINTVGYNLDANVMVLSTEVTKILLVCSLCMVWFRKTPFPGPVRWGFAVNALLYAVTNTLTYLILERADLTTYLVLSQQKFLVHFWV